MESNNTSQEKKGCTKCNKNKEVKTCKTCSDTKKKLMPYFILPSVILVFTIVGIVETVKFIIGLFTQ